MPPSFEVLTFNFRHVWADDGLQSWPLRAEAVRRIVCARPAEVFCFQEINRHILDYLRACLPGHALGVDPVDHGPRWEYRPVLVRPPSRILEVETFSLSETPDLPSKSWNSRYVRQTTRVLLSRHGLTLTVYNTHMDFEAETQLRQAAALWRLIGQRDLDRPAILAGDFNATPVSPAYAFLTGRLEFEGQRGDFRDASPAPQAATYHGFAGQPEARTLDWILYRGPGLRLARPALVITDRWEGLYPSDHFPVAAGFNLEPA
jgi:endonuclease/exonuclease/phosphatase family metal-dependent hydrolase